MHNRAPQVFNKDTVLKNVDPGNMEAQMMENLISHKPYFILVTSLVQVIMFFLYAWTHEDSITAHKPVAGSAWLWYKILGNGASRTATSNKDFIDFEDEGCNDLRQFCL